MEILASLATAAGLGWASGIRLYAVVFFLGLLQQFGIYNLPADLQTLGNPWVIGASGFMFLVEFLADKIPGFDSVWDAAHTFIRIPAGALLAAGSHITKASTRALINTSPEPLSNWTASFSEDALSIGAVWMALVHPLLLLGFLIVFFMLAIWLLPKIWRGLKRVLASIRQLLGNPA